MIPHQPCIYPSMLWKKAKTKMQEKWVWECCKQRPILLWFQSITLIRNKREPPLYLHPKKHYYKFIITTFSDMVPYIFLPYHFYYISQNTIYWTTWVNIVNLKHIFWKLRIPWCLWHSSLGVNRSGHIANQRFYRYWDDFMVHSVNGPVRKCNVESEREEPAQRWYAIWTIYGQDFFART